nr:hypothetical protein GCM10025699_28860 [Microbacterium flavescens]
MTGLVFSTHRAAAVFGRPAATAPDALAPTDGALAPLPNAVFSLDPRLNGPRRSANGGYAAGTIARQIDADIVTVVLRRPVPLRRLLVARPDGKGARSFMPDGGSWPRHGPARWRTPRSPSHPDSRRLSPPVTRIRSPGSGIRSPTVSCADPSAATACM